MPILLTGGTGYIASHTAVVLMQMGHEVVLYDNLSNSQESVLARLQSIAAKPVRFVKGDVRDTALLRHTLQSHGIDAVMHFAGLKAVGQSVEDPVNYYAHNVQGTISLLQAMQAQQLKTLVFSSSATVYGQPQYLPLDEQHPTSAINPYGRSKLHIEHMLQDVAASDPAWRIACLRYFNPVGAHDSGLIGESPHGTPNNLMPYITQVAAGQRSALNVFGDDYETHDGTGVRDYIHVMDLAEGHAAALRFLSEAKGWHAINLGTGQGYSVLDLVKAFENASGRKVPYKVVARRAGDTAQCFANPEKAKTWLGWQAKRDLHDMCESAWKYQIAAK
ncbi:MAG: UDP-glucose 4-epimerase GalE [Limnohabitans sp.]